MCGDRRERVFIRGRNQCNVRFFLLIITNKQTKSQRSWIRSNDRREAAPSRLRSVSSVCATIHAAFQTHFLAIHEQTMLTHELRATRRPRNHFLTSERLTHLERRRIRLQTRRFQPMFLRFSVSTRPERSRTARSTRSTRSTAFLRSQTGSSSGFARAASPGSPANPTTATL